MSDPDVEAVFRRVCAALPDAVWLRPTDMSRISYANGAVESTLGVDRSTLRENPDSYAGAIHPDDRERYRELLAEVRDRATEDGTVERRRIEYRVRDGRTTRYVSETVFPVTDGDGALCSWPGSPAR